MTDILERYPKDLSRAYDIIDSYGIERTDLTENDAVRYCAETREKYRDIKEGLAERALLLTEQSVDGRSAATFQFDRGSAGDETYPELIELLERPKRDYDPEGASYLQFVTRNDIEQFYDKYPNLVFGERGDETSRILELRGAHFDVRFRDKTAPLVPELEQEQ